MTTTTTFERRSHADPVEIRAARDGGMPTIGGWGIRFEKRSLPLGRGFVEVVDRRAVTKTLGEADILGLWNHNLDQLLGRSASGTLRTEARADGVDYALDLPDTSLGRDVAELVRRGDVTGSSFGFRTISEEWGRTDDGFPLRRLTEIALRDLSPVVTPAYPDASVALRGLAEQTGIEVRALADLVAEDQLIRALDADSPRQFYRRRVVV